MLDQPEQSDGKINWPMAIGLSMVVHIVVLGFFWMVSGPSAAKSEEPKETAQEQASAPAPGSTEPVTAGNTAAATTTTPGVPTSTTTPPAAEATENYTVKPGDFPSRIARANGCTVADLKRLNGAVIDKTLHPGQILKIPAK